MRENVGGELLSLAGDLQEESFDGRIANMVRRIPESVLSVPAGRDQSVQRPTLCVLGHRFPSYAIFRNGFKNKARRKRRVASGEYCELSNPSLTRRAEGPVAIADKFRRCEEYLAGPTALAFSARESERSLRLADPV